MRKVPFKTKLEVNLVPDIIILRKPQRKKAIEKGVYIIFVPVLLFAIKITVGI